MIREMLRRRVIFHLGKDFPAIQAGMSRSSTQIELAGTNQLKAPGIGEAVTVAEFFPGDDKATPVGFVIIGEQEAPCSGARWRFRGAGDSEGFPCAEHFGFGVIGFVAAGFLLGVTPIKCSP